MNLMQQGILTLIRSALTGKAMSLPEGFSLEEAEETILKHQIIGLAYEGAVACGIPKTEPVMGRLFQRYCQVMIRSNNQMAALEKLYTAFEENGIDYLPVKGCVLKSLYPSPAMRTMGDADVLIRYEQYAQIKPIMEALGYTAKREWRHELPWDHPHLHLELHRWLIPEHHRLEHNYFADVWQRAVHVNGCRYDLSPEDAFVYLFDHYVKHYRAGGIGLRQPLDLWIWQQTHPQLDMVRIRDGMEKLQLLTFFENTQRMLQVWLQNTEADDRSLFMTDYIFSSGSFGKQATHQASEGLRRVRETGSIRLGRLKMIWTSLFPSVLNMRQRYPVLNRAPWLLPIFWPVRWVSVLLFRRQNIRRFQESLSEDSAHKIETFEQSLNYVGLDFHL